MKFSISADNVELIKAGQELLRLFFPAFELVPAYGDEGAKLSLMAGVKDRVVMARVKLSQGDKLFTETRDEPLIDAAEAHNQSKRLVRLALLEALESFSGRWAGPWGILVGIRPTKIVHRLLDMGWTIEQVIEHLQKGYRLSEEKSILLTEICSLERPFLLSRDQAGRVISIYIGIPFCPTRCAYCSFPAYSLDKWKQIVDPFLGALHREITAFGEVIREKGLTVETVYIGGGTPTSLNADQMQSLLEVIRANLIGPETREFTVEAGRPDTIDREKLIVMKTAGVSRLSINPQSMVESTLRTIGRSHTPDDVVRAVEEARETGFDNINMDIIIGLPGEGLDEVRQTLRRIGQLQPENLTVHTLAVKRASGIKENRESFALPAPDMGPLMMAETYRFAADHLSMHPYYLYRQKQMVSPLENVGLARAGHDCIYNIQMIEERQTILGLGAGAGSKFVRPADWTLESFYNPKDPLNYVERIEELITRKVDKLLALR